MRSWLLGAVLVLSGCAKSVPLQCSGPTGFASDRAHEIVLHTEGEAPALPSDMGGDSVGRAAFARLASLEAAGQPQGRALFPGWAFIQTSLLSPRSAAIERTRFQMEVTSFARDDSHRAPYPYPSSDGVTYEDPGSSLLGTTPPWSELGGPQLVHIGAIFGQITVGDLTADDEGYWSAGALAEALTARGFVSAGGVYRSGRLEVEIIEPFLAPIFDEITRDRTRDLIARSDVVYLNGHAETPLMDALALAESWRPARPRLVFADTCSSYFHEATRAQSVSGPAHLIVTDGRTVTGSIESFFPVIDALQAPDKAETWRALLVRMNDLAAARAAERRGKVEAILEPPEVYGVVPPRRP